MRLTRNAQGVTSVMTAPMLLRKFGAGCQAGDNNEIDENPSGRCRDRVNGVLAGTVDQVDGEVIQLVKQASESNKPSRLHRYIPIMFVAKIEDGRVFLSTRADAAVMFEDHAKAPSWQQRTDRSPTR